MREWTEQEEQEMIERAKAGEPAANYELSLWALARSEEEPDEPRWNRLAAKCLVKAAQAGYGPAQKQMAALLKSADEPAPAPSQPEQDQPPRRETAKAPAEATEREPVSIREARRSRTKGPTATARRPVRPEPEQDEPEDEEALEAEDAAAEDAPVTAGRHSSPAKRSAPARRKTAPRRSAWPEPKDEPEDEDEPPEEDDREQAVKARPARKRERSAGGKKGGGLFADWGDAQWRRLEFICVGICVALLIAIAVMLLTGRRGGSESGTTPTVPPAGEAAPAAATDVPMTTVEQFPDTATRAAIQAADLDIPPAEEDYRDGPTTATVSVNSVSLRLRKGPNTSYSEITSMPDGSKVEVFADKNDWSLVRFQGEESPIYGWCSSSYLIIDATPVAIG